MRRTNILNTPARIRLSFNTSFSVTAKLLVLKKRSKYVKFPCAKLTNKEKTYARDEYFIQTTGDLHPAGTFILQLNWLSKLPSTNFGKPLYINHLLPVLAIYLVAFFNFIYLMESSFILTPEDMDDKNLS